MNFNKCNRCGCFFQTNGSVCPNCAQKDELEILRLKNYIEENENENYNMDDVISYTGISNKNLTRFLAQEQFSNIANNIQNNNNNNITQC